MARTIRLPVSPPLWYQRPSWRAVHNGCRLKLISYPRRHGKDFEDLSLAAWISLKRKGTYYYVFPTRAWGKRAIWDTMAEVGGVTKRVVDHIYPADLVARKNENDLMIELKNGSLFFMGGSDKLDFVGQGGQGYTMSEFSLHKEEVTGLLDPIIQQSNAYLHMNGTLRGKNNPLYERLVQTQGLAGWHSRWLKLEQTKLYCWVGDEVCINPELLPFVGTINPRTGDYYRNCQGVPYYNIQDSIDSGAVSFAMAMREYVNDAETHGSSGYYSYELLDLEKRDGKCELDPFKDLVYTFWDLGGVREDSDTTCILFAHIDMISKTAKIVDYYENRGVKRGHYFEVLQQKGYDYGGHYFPHDAKRSNDWTGETTADTAYREHDMEIRFVPKTQNVLNDIEITRRAFRNFTFDAKRCDILLSHVANYHEKEATGRPCHQNNCTHCRGASHGADTLRCMAMAMHLNLVVPYLDRSRPHSHWREPPPEEEVFLV